MSSPPPGLLDELESVCTTQDSLLAVAARLVVRAIRLELGQVSPKPLLMLASEAAEALKLSPSTVRRMARTGEIGCIRVDGVLRFRREDLDEWISRRQKRPFEVAGASAYLPRRRKER